MTDNDNEIEALVNYLKLWQPDSGRYRALTALVAERDGLREENNALRSRCKVHQDEVLDRVFEMDALRKRVAELESHPPADRDRHLRERLVCAAMTGFMADSSKETYREHWAVIAVQQADAAIAAMRKGESDGK